MRSMWKTPCAHSSLKRTNRTSICSEMALQTHLRLVWPSKTFCKALQKQNVSWKTHITSSCCSEWYEKVACKSVFGEIMLQTSAETQSLVGKKVLCLYRLKGKMFNHCGGGGGGRCILAFRENEALKDAWYLLSVSCLRALSFRGSVAGGQLERQASETETR